VWFNSISQYEANKIKQINELFLKIVLTIFIHDGKLHLRCYRTEDKLCKEYFL